MALASPSDTAAAAAGGDGNSRRRSCRDRKSNFTQMQDFIVDIKSLKRGSRRSNVEPTTSFPTPVEEVTAVQEEPEVFTNPESVSEPTSYPELSLDALPKSVETPSEPVDLVQVMDELPIDDLPSLQSEDPAPTPVSPKKRKRQRVSGFVRRPRKQTRPEGDDDDDPNRKRRGRKRKVVAEGDGEALTAPSAAEESTSGAAASTPESTETTEPMAKRTRKLPARFDNPEFILLSAADKRSARIPVPAKPEASISPSATETDPTHYLDGSTEVPPAPVSESPKEFSRFTIRPVPAVGVPQSNSLVRRPLPGRREVIILKPAAPAKGPSALINRKGPRIVRVMDPHARPKPTSTMRILPRRVMQIGGVPKPRRQLTVPPPAPSPLLTSAQPSVSPASSMENQENSSVLRFPDEKQQEKPALFTFSREQQKHMPPLEPYVQYCLVNQNGEILVPQDASLSDTTASTCGGDVSFFPDESSSFSVHPSPTPIIEPRPDYTLAVL